MSKIEVNEIAARSGTNIAMTSGHTIQPNFHSSTTFPAGHVIQVVQSDFTGTTETSTSTSYANTSLAVTITPTSTNSKILITSTFLGQTTSDAYYDLKRGSTNLGGTNGFMRIELSGDAFPIGINLLDEPSTTSATTYTIAMRIASSGTVYMVGSPYKSTIQALEISG